MCLKLRVCALSILQLSLKPKIGSHLANKSIKILNPCQFQKLLYSCPCYFDLPGIKLEEKSFL